MEHDKTTLPYPWFERAAYARAVEIMSDADYWPESYESWHELAKNAMSRLSTDEVQAVRISIDPNQFDKWCRLNAREADSDARLTYAALTYRAHDTH